MAAFVFTVLFWPFWLLPYWLQRLPLGPGTAARRAGSFVGGALLNPLLLPIVRHVVRAVTSWEPEWPMEFPSVPSTWPLARAGERPEQPEPDGGDCGGADDRDRARVVHRALTNGMKASNREAIEEQIAADFVTSLDGYTVFPLRVGDRRCRVDGVATAARPEDIADRGRRREPQGLDTIADAYVFDWRRATRCSLSSARRRVLPNYAPRITTSPSATRSRFARRPTSRRSSPSRDLRAPPFYPLIESERLDRAVRLALRPPRNRWTLVNVAGEPARRRA